ncbi:acetylajmalan esterase-like [Coffea arabica]|uniref:Acetylajmalan esterase-like n=1 Tax=Coffea arabica TaxID=13443 RepID=A0ABM4VQT6_COFAR
MTYFHRPIGRCSNGLLMIDFISRALNLPLLDPYLKITGVFNQGVDFAVAGSLDTSFFQARNILVPISNTPLRAQMQWFKDHLKSVCHSPSDCAARLQRSLIKSCCGIGGIYNYDGRWICETPGVPVCREPEKYIYWDGIHMTQKVCRHMQPRI